MTWLALVLKALRWDLAMQLATQEFRQRHAESWVAGALQTGEVGPADAPEAVAALTEPDCLHPWFDRFALANLRYYSWVFDSARDNLGIGSRPRVVDPDHEDTVIVDLRDLPDDATVPATGIGAVVRGGTPHLAVVQIRHSGDAAMTPFQVALVEINPDHLALRQKDPDPIWTL